MNTIWKQALRVGLFLSLLITLVSCTQGNEAPAAEPAPTESAPAGPATIVCWHGTGEDKVDYGDGEIGHEITIAYAEDDLKNGVNLYNFELPSPWYSETEKGNPAAFSLKACKADDSWYGHPEWGAWFYQIRYLKWNDNHFIVGTEDNGTGTTYQLDPIKPLALTLPTEGEATSGNPQLLGYEASEPRHDLPIERQ